MDALSALQQAVREHRDARGDDRCWLDDETLYKCLPEGYTPVERDTTVELDMCRKFILNRRHPLTIYESPQRCIERLEKETHIREGFVGGWYYFWRVFTHSLPFVIGFALAATISDTAWYTIKTIFWTVIR